MTYSEGISYLGFSYDYIFFISVRTTDLTGLFVPLIANYSAISRFDRELFLEYFYLDFRLNKSIAIKFSSLYYLY